MSGDQLRFPGRAALWRRVLRVCGPGRQFEALGYPLSAWIRHGQDALPATVERVEPYLAAYLAKAESIGRWRGTIIGATVGLVGLAVTVITIMVMR